MRSETMRSFGMFSIQLTKSVSKLRVLMVHKT